MHGHVVTAAFDLVCTSHNALGDEINDLTDVQDDAESRSSDHEVREDLLFSGVTDVTVHLVWARRHLTLDQPWQVETVIDPVEDVEEGDLDARLDEETDQVGPPQATMFLACVAVQLTALTVLGPVLALAVITVRHVHDYHEGRASYKDELQGPQANVGDGEEVVIAYVGTSRLLGVAVKVLLLVTPHSFSRHHVHHHPEHKHH